MDVCTRNLWKRAEMGKKTSTVSTTRVPGVGTLPEGYIRNVPLPQFPRVQSAKSRVQVHTIPEYYNTMYAVPTYISPCSRVESAAYAYSLAWHAIAINN
jgi:hypothetical protein